MFFRVATTFVFSLFMIQATIAMELVRLTGESSPKVISKHLDVSIEGNVGYNTADTSSPLLGYWTSASVTGNANTSNENIHNAFHFTVRDLESGASLTLSEITFDYHRKILNGSHPVMEVFLDSGDGYGDAVLRVDDEPTSSQVTTSLSIPYDVVVQNGDTLTIGFSFSDRHGMTSRTHLIDNFRIVGKDQIIQYGDNIKKHGASLASLIGDETPESISPYLDASLTGNTGNSPDYLDGPVGYWTSARATTNTSSNTQIYTAFTFTATDLSDTQSIQLKAFNFDLHWKTLNGSNPVVNLYVDYGEGYEETPLFTESAGPTADVDMRSYSVSIDKLLTNNESVTFGFSYSDIHGLVRRTYTIDNVDLRGTTNLEALTSGLDLNLNGVSDLWEYKYNAYGLVYTDELKNADFDGDGVSNYDEALAGTNPRDKSSRFRQRLTASSTTDTMSVEFSTTLGKQYAVQGNATLDSSSWEDTDTITGDGGLYAMDLSDINDLDRYFYRIAVTDIDSDNDGLTQAEETWISGLSDTNTTSNGEDHDYNKVLSLMESLNNSQLSLSVDSSTLYEDLSNRVAITVERSAPDGNEEFLELSYDRSYEIVDTTVVTSNAASSGDYQITDAEGTVLTTPTFTIPAGETSTTLYIAAIDDGTIEPDEQLSFTIADELQVTLWISDSEDTSSDDYIAISQAGHFLSQASMGGTPESISELANEIKSVGYITACENWIDSQLLLPRESSTTDDCFAFQTAYLGEGNNVPSINIQNFELIWWGKMVQTQEQFRHRMAYTLSQVFVTSSAFWANSERYNVWRSYTSYYDKLTDAIDSTHRELIQTISYDPFMCVYLSAAQNKKADPTLGTTPDENYAREVMQLFSCGVYSQDQSGNYLLDTAGSRIENYTNADITELSEVFTGLGMSDENGDLENFDAPDIIRGNQYVYPMQMVQEHHDESTKILLDGTILPAGQSGDDDISDALDVLASHSSTAPHLSRLLIKRLTSSNPSNDYISRVTEAWRGEGTYGTGEVGNLVSIFKAILLDSEARDAITFTTDADGVVTATPTANLSNEMSSTGRLKEPIIKRTQFYRFAQSIAGHSSDDVPRWKPLTKPAANDQTPDFGQIPMRAPSVFNYYDSDYSPSTGDIAQAKEDYGIEFTSPETEILTPYVIRQFEAIYDQIISSAPSTSFQHTYNTELFTATYNYLRYLYDKSTSIEDFIDDVNLWLCNGQISPTLRSELATIANDNGGLTNQNMGAVLSIIINSSDFSVSF